MQGVPHVGSSLPWGAFPGSQGPALHALHAVLLSAEIIFLRAITPAYPANHADIIFDITDGNLRDSFDIIKRYMDGMTVGEWPETAGPPRLPLVLPASGLAEARWEPARLPSESPGPSGLSWNPPPHTHPSQSQCEEHQGGGAASSRGDPCGLSLPTYKGWIN